MPNPLKNIIIYFLSVILDWRGWLVYGRNALDSGLKSVAANFFALFRLGRTNCGCISPKHRIVHTFLPFFSAPIFDKIIFSCFVL